MIKKTCACGNVFILSGVNPSIFVGSVASPSPGVSCPKCNSKVDIHYKEIIKIQSDKLYKVVV